LPRLAPPADARRILAWDQAQVKPPGALRHADAAQNNTLIDLILRDF
jgi:hypothetical protein